MRDVQLLVPEFRVKVEKLYGDLLRDGHHLRPFFTLRTPWDQARLWRQSRITAEIHEQIRRLVNAGAPWLAHVLNVVGPQQGRWATNAVPGLSWHQHGEAVDSFVLEQGRAIWSRRHPGYEAYAKRAREMGMEAGFFWTHQDAVHVQMRAGRVLDRYTWPELDALLKERFGEEETA